MHVEIKFRFVIAALVALFAMPFAPIAAPQSKAATAKSIRCVFPLNSTGTWKKDGAPEAGVNPSTLVLRFESINVDEGTAQLKNGSVGSELIVRYAEGYLHFIQAFRTGPMYTTTIFDNETPGGKFKAVHSRHEYFSVPLAGATSSPEQYYGECDVMN